MPSGNPCFAVSVLLVLGSSNRRKCGLVASGKHVDCWQKGRLLHLAYDHAMKYLQDGVAEAGTWTRASFGGHQDWLEELSACTVGHWPQPRRKSASWIWYRGFSPDSTTMVYARVLQQWESTPPAQHHAITRLFLMPGTDLRRAIDDMAGGTIAPCLVAAMMRLRLVHADDSVGEGPHIAATRIGAARIASSVRMKQNLVEFVSLTDEAHLSRQQLWNKYKSVLQRRQQSRVRGQRNFRCSRALFEKQVYVLDRRFDPSSFRRWPRGS